MAKVSIVIYPLWGGARGFWLCHHKNLSDPPMRPLMTLVPQTT